MKQITITKTANANALGHRSSGNCKPVMCITTGMIYASATDAAEQIGISQSVLSMAAAGKLKTCMGKRWCYVSNVMQHLDEISQNIQLREEKLLAYDTIINAQKRKDELEKRKAKLEELRKKLEVETAAIKEEEQNLGEVLYAGI